MSLLNFISQFPLVSDRDLVSQQPDQVFSVPPVGPENSRVSTAEFFGKRLDILGGGFLCECSKGTLQLLLRNLRHIGNQPARLDSIDVPILLSVDREASQIGALDFPEILSFFLVLEL